MRLRHTRQAVTYTDSSAPAHTHSAWADSELWLGTTCGNLCGSDSNAYYKDGDSSTRVKSKVSPSGGLVQSVG